MEQLPISLHLLKKPVDAADDGLVIAEQRGDDTIVLCVNEPFERLTGYPQDEILYLDCRFLLGEGRNQSARQTIDAPIEANPPGRVPLLNYPKDGSPIWNERARDQFPMSREQCLAPRAVAAGCLHLLQQQRSA